MDKEILERMEAVEKRMAALEEQVQIQPKDGRVTVAGIDNEIDLPRLIDRVMNKLRREIRKP